jgi:4-aminobutyrate aminotransferase-like enzyme
MSAWPPSTGEAIHTSTFIGNPIACAAALAQIEEIESRGLLQRASELGRRVQNRTQAWLQKLDTVIDVRGVGLIQAVELRDEGAALDVANRCLQHGVLLLMEGAKANILAITPPAVITDAQLDYALDMIESSLYSLLPFEE